MKTRIALSLSLALCAGSACHGKNGQTTPVKQVAHDLVSCLGACAMKCASEVVSNGIGTSPSEPKPQE